VHRVGKVVARVQLRPGQGSRWFANGVAVAACLANQDSGLHRGVGP
jgi:hypothetical protein